MVTAVIYGMSFRKYVLKICFKASKYTASLTFREKVRNISGTCIAQSIVPRAG